MFEEWSDGIGRVSYSAGATPGERTLLLRGILGWLGGVLYAAPIDLFGDVFPRAFGCPAGRLMSRQRPARS